MKLSQLKQALANFEIKKAPPYKRLKRSDFVRNESYLQDLNFIVMEWLQEYVLHLEVQQASAFLNDDEDITYEDFIRYIQIKEKEQRKTSDYLKLNEVGSNFFVAWSQEDHNKKTWMYQFPPETLVHIFKFLDKKAVSAMGQSTQFFYYVVKEHHLVSQAPFPLLDYTQPLLEGSKSCKSSVSAGSGVSRMAVLSDREIIADAKGGALGIWDVKTGHCKLTLEGPTSEIKSIIVLSSKRLIVGGGTHDGALYLWDAQTGKCKHVLKGHTDWVTALVQLPNKTVLSASEDHTLRIWDIETGLCKHVLKGHWKWVNELAVLQSGNIAMACEDESLYIWDIVTGTCQKRLEGHLDWLTAVKVLDSGDILSGAEDGMIYLWDVQTGICKLQIEGHKKAVTSLAILPNKHVASGSDDGTIRIWELQTGRCIQKIKAHTKAISIIEVLPTGDLISGSSDGTFCIWRFAYLAIEPSLQLSF